MKNAAIILASVLLTIAVYNIGAGNYANRVEYRTVHVVPEKSNSTCTIYRTDPETLVLVIQERKVKK
jgi:hypothetical protein